MSVEEVTHICRGGKGDRNAPTMKATIVRWALMALIVTLLATPFPSASADVDSSIRGHEWPLDGSHYQVQRVAVLSTGQGITVALLDSGVDAQHPDLLGQVLDGASFVGDTTDEGHTDLSSDSHGTSLAAIIAGSGRGKNGTGMLGLAPGARILPVRVSEGSQITPAAVAKAIKYATDQHAQIVTISLTTDDPDPTIRAAINYALARNTVVVAAAGNLGQQGDPELYPASFPGVVSVTGVDSSGNFWPQSESGPHTALAAPALDIYSAASGGGYLTGNGTSYAAPYVAATAALIWSAHRELTSGQVIHQLIATAQHRGASGRDNRYGYGILDPLAALAVAPSADTQNPLMNVDSASVPQTSTIPLVVGIVGGGVALVLGAASVLFLRRRRRVREHTPR